MKLSNDFASFLRENVDLNQTRLTDLENNVAALSNFLRQQDWGVRIRSIKGQGSWAHQTIIKPVDQGEFDADILVIIDPVEGWSAEDYVDELYRAFRDSVTYREKVQRFRYCVTITYAGVRKVDIAPCVRNRLWSESYEVCNRDQDRFEQSAPVAYTDWIKERNGYSGRNSFRKVTRLLKYLRDIKGRFTCPSVLLTTLVGNQIDWADKGTVEFEDVPTTLQTIIGRLDDWLQGHPIKPRIPNPKLTTEDFAAQLTQDQYANFRNMIHKYRSWVDEACNAESRAGSIKAWRRLFGDDFAKGEDVSVLAASNIVEKAASKSLILSTAAHLDSLVDDVINFGRRVLPAAFYRPPYQKPPPWLAAPTVSRNVQIATAYHASRNAGAVRQIDRGDALPRNGGLWFTAFVNGFQPVPEGFRVEWRITNTGTEALLHRAGRGTFYQGQRRHSRWESLDYRGVHIAEAFIVRTSDETLVGQSEPFEVVIR